MVVAAVRAVYGQMPSPLGAGADPLAEQVLPWPFLVPAQLVAVTDRWQGAGSALHRIYGTISVGMTFHVALRTRALDAALRESLELGAKQIVVLGAGLDGRAFRLRELEGLRVFEVDHPNTQRDKKERLAKAELQPIADVVFVPVDFEKDRLDESLREAGLSSTIPSFWIWEGVTVYLTPDAVRSTLLAIASSSAPGSRVALTYARPPSQSAASSRPLIYRGMRALVHFGSAVLGTIGEAVRGFLQSPELEALANETGFRVVSDENAADWAARYWPGQSPGPFEWERIAVLERRNS
jgi:methyltransferase (TIGR00027 family)